MDVSQDSGRDTGDREGAVFYFQSMTLLPFTAPHSHPWLLFSFYVKRETTWDLGTGGDICDSLRVG
jgi:hypothetical protein